MQNAFAEFNRNVWKFTEDWTRVRLIGEIRSVYEFWIPILTSTGKRVVIPKICLDWDAQRHLMITENCPYRHAGLTGRPVYYSNAIIRSKQNSNTASAEAASPVHVLKIPPRFYEALQTFAAINRRTTKSGEVKCYDVAHRIFGKDIRVKINSDKPYGYYDVELVKCTKLTAEELAYPLLSLAIKPETLSQARDEWRKLKVLNVGASSRKPEATPLHHW